jgi:hypothetical protein
MSENIVSVIVHSISHELSGLCRSPQGQRFEVQVEHGNGLLFLLFNVKIELALADLIEKQDGYETFTSSFIQ